jgi:hypothetical protein
MRAAFNYYKILLSVNIPFSFIFGYIYGVPGFIITFCTLGLLLSAVYFELYYKERYYFYYNKGYSKFRLISLSFLANIALVIVFLGIKKVVAG